MWKPWITAFLIAEFLHCLKTFINPEWKIKKKKFQSLWIDVDNYLNLIIDLAFGEGLTQEI